MGTKGPFGNHFVPTLSKSILVGFILSLLCIIISPTLSVQVDDCSDKCNPCPSVIFCFGGILIPLLWAHVDKEQSQMDAVLRRLLGINMFHVIIIIVRAFGLVV